MDSRDRVVIRVPPELKMVLMWYQSGARIMSLNAAIIRLLETHPVLVQLAAERYDAAMYASPPERIS